MDYKNFCRNYFAVTNIPMTLMEKTTPIYSSLCELLSIEPSKTFHVFWELSPSEPNPCFCRYSPDIEYGWVHIEGTDYYVIIGPVFSVPVNDELVRQYMREDAIPSNYREAVSEFLCSIPNLSHRQFTMHLSLLHMSLNHREMDFPAFSLQQAPNMIETEQQYTKEIAHNRESNKLHNTYHFEEQLWEHVKQGDVEKLKDFLSSSPTTLSEGKLANTPLRQAKNLFIITTAKVGILGAVSSGIDTEKVYQLMDLYIQECEQLQSIQAVKGLQYSMLIDFCQKAGEVQIPEGISSEVFRCMNYIRSHTNEAISIKDVAAQIHRSTSYTVRHFKDELGINMGAFITRCKLEEAKSLLTYTDKTLAEISSYLCFTNQPYFQSVFKKQYGITPLQYRKQGRQR